MRRRAILATLCLPALPAAAQGRAHLLAILSPGQLSIDAFRRWAIPELAREGFVEGRNLQVVARSADGDPRGCGCSPPSSSRCARMSCSPSPTRRRMPCVPSARRCRS